MLCLMIILHAASLTPEPGGIFYLNIQNISFDEYDL
jgi:hypothetical protein